MKRLTITSRTGHFNYCDPSEKSISCLITIFEGNDVFMSTSLKLDYEENPTIAYAEDAIYLLEECIKKMWIDTSREKKEEMLKFLKENGEDIDEGSKKYRVEILKSQIKKAREEIKRLTNPI